MSEWKTSACILCECNCGIQVQLGGDNDREIVRIRGDKAHPASQGYLCQKASGLNYYQNGKDRITSPLRRRPDGIVGRNPGEMAEGRVEEEPERRGAGSGTNVGVRRFDACAVRSADA